MHKIYICYPVSILFAIFFILPASAKMPVWLVDIQFGKAGVIQYDLRSGTFNVTQSGHQVFSAVSASGVINADTISSKNYQLRKYSRLTITDSFGKGFKHTIMLSEKNKPDLQQIFYTYKSREYFFTEIIFKGSELKSNYMMPFYGRFNTIEGQDLRNLFVPFDNDTFISYDSKRFVGDTSMISSEVGTVYSDDSRKGIVAGSIEHEVWKSGVQIQSQQTGNYLKVWGGYTAEAVTRDKIVHGSISGNVIKSPRIFIGSFTDWRTGMEEFGKANRIAEPPFVFNWTKPTPVGWNSWGVIQENIDFDKIIKVANFFADSIPAFRTGNTAYIDLDSYWDKLVSNGDYSKLKQVADYCKSKGLEPGVYWAPFTDWGHTGGPDRIAEGSKYKFGDMWTKTGVGYHDLDGARALDPTHPGTRQRIDYVTGQLKACGFKMIKIDFLGHGAIEGNHFFDPKITTGMQAYHAGMEYLINNLGGQMLVYAAISPSLATGRYVHMRRIACDAFKTIEHTKYTLNSLTYGWWQTNLYNYLDADHVVFGDEAAGTNRARLLSALVTGTWVTGDDFSRPGQWTGPAKKYYQDKELLELINDGKAFRPAEGNTGTGASAVYSKQVGHYFYMAVFNYTKNNRNFQLDPNRLSVSLKNISGVKEILQQNAISLEKKISFNLKGEDAVLYKFNLKQ